MAKRKNALEELLEELHKLTAEELIKIIKDGVPVYSKDTGEVIGTSPAPAAYIAAAIKFLKDNDITAERAPASPLDDLAKSLPSFDDEEDFDLSRMQ